MKTIISLFLIFFIAEIIAQDTCLNQINIQTSNIESVCNQDTLIVFNQSQVDALNANYYWFLNNELISTQKDLSHFVNYDLPSIYTQNLKLKIELDNGCKDSLVKTINMLPKPIFNFDSYQDQNYYYLFLTNKYEINQVKWTYKNNDFWEDTFKLNLRNHTFEDKNLKIKVTNDDGCISNTVYTLWWTNLTNIQKNEALVFANPNLNHISILNTQADFNYELIDINGKVIQKGLIQSGNNTIQVLKSGTYFLKTIGKLNQIFMNQLIVF